jgi:hypothetical protein
MFQKLEDALLQGRKLKIELLFVDDESGQPVVEASVWENGLYLGGDTGADSVEQALELLADWVYRNGEDDDEQEHPHD